MNLTTKQLKQIIQEELTSLIKEKTAAFHGWKMKPTQMRVSPQCDKPPDDNQWEAEEEGCPQFTNDKGVGAEHEDVLEAINFINNVKPKTLIAYSRGGAMAVAAFNKGVQHKPTINFVAPAWKRGWVSQPSPSISVQGAIIHGTKDAAVPLRQSFELSAASGLPLYVFPERKHINILKFKSKPEAGTLVSPEVLQQGLKSLPDWGTGKSKPEQVQQQHDTFMRLLGK